MWTLNFLKRRVRYQNTKLMIEGKVWVVSKNHKYVSCSSQRDLFDDNNFGQHNYFDLLLPKYVFILKIGLKTLKITMWQGGWGGCIYWCSDLHITSKWSSKGPFNSPETVLCHVEYLSFGRRTKFGEISILATFSYHFIHKNSVLFSTVFYL